jgi:ferredoxin
MFKLKLNGKLCLSCGICMDVCRSKAIDMRTNVLSRIEGDPLSYVLFHSHFNGEKLPEEMITFPSQGGYGRPRNAKNKTADKRCSGQHRPRRELSDGDGVKQPRLSEPLSCVLSLTTSCARSISPAALIEPFDSGSFKGVLCKRYMPFAQP